MGIDKLFGAWGELQAAEYLRKKRYELVATGFSCKYGEIDLIVQNKKYLVFVEVKTRKDDSFASAREYVGTAKQNRLRATAAYYLSKNTTNRQPRFDVVEIYAPDGVLTKKPEIHHMEDAFQ